MRSLLFVSILALVAPLPFAAAASPPEIEPLDDVMMVEGGVIQVGVVARDADGDAITLSASGLPGFATLTDRADGSGVLRFAPGTGQRGAYPITLRATAGGDEATRTLVVRVAERADVSAERVGDELVQTIPGAVVRLTMDLRNTGTDVDGLRLTVTGPHGWGLPLPRTQRIPAGGLVRASFDVRVPDSAEGARGAVELVLRSSADPARFVVLSWVIEVPALVDVTMDDVAPLPGAPITGSVYARTLDGEPVRDAIVRIEQQSVGGRLAWSVIHVRTDDQGRASFSIDHPYAYTPGRHHVTATVKVGVGWSGQASYSAQPVV